MIEVFKTDVTNAAQAYLLKCEIRLAFTEYEVNFDLEDCDHILRVKSSTDSINNSGLILLLARQGFRADVLPDDDVEASQLMSEHLLPYKD